LTGELLLELLSEEIPAKMQRGAVAELTRLLRGRLATAELPAAAMRGYAELGVQHIMFQCEPYTLEARQRLTEALQLYRGMERKTGTPLNMKPSDNTK